MEKQYKLLIVEDEAGLAKQLKWGLMETYQIYLAHNCDEALKMVDEKQIVINIDLRPLEYGIKSLAHAIRERSLDSMRCRKAELAGQLYIKREHTGIVTVHDAIDAAQKMFDGKPRQNG